MKTSRTLLLMLAGLAGGIGVRLGFSLPSEPETQRHRSAADSAAQKIPDNKSPAESFVTRPQESEILAATGGARYRLLVAWLPGAGADELLRMAEALSRKDRSFLADLDHFGVSLLMVRWAEVDPQAMVAWTRSHYKGQYRLSVFQDDAITAWARVDFDSAWASACSGQPATRAAALFGLATVDPDKCLQMLRADPKLLQLGGHTTMGSVLEKIAARHPAAAAALLTGSAAQNAGLSGPVASAWVKTDPAAAIAWIKSLGPALPGEAVDDAGRWLAAHAREHLPSLLECLPAGPLRTSLQSAGVAQLAATDPDAAVRQLDAMPAGPLQKYSSALLLKELCRTGNDTAAIALASRIGWSFSDEWAPSYSETVYGPDLTSISTVSGDLETAGIRDAMSELFGRIAVRDPAQAAAVLSGCEPGAIDELLTGGSRTQPAAVAEVLLTAGGNSRHHLNHLAENWMARDPAAAATWASTRGDVMDSFFHHWSSHPDAALAWAAAQPAALRQPLLEKTIEGWALNNGPRIGDAIRHSPLPEDEKQKLLTLVPSP